MSGTRIGGLKVAKKLRDRDPEYYPKIGAMGGNTPKRPGGFAADRDRASAAGRKGALKRAENFRKKKAERDIILGK